MKKLNNMVEGDMILKYQVIPEELDALVSVKSDEDLKLMVDEYNRLESEASPKLRSFLFPMSPMVAGSQVNPVHVDTYAIEQRYIEAVNGIVSPSSSSTSGRFTPVPVPVNPNSRPIFSISTCSSPASPDDGIFFDSLPPESPFLSGYYHNIKMSKVQSSPSSLYSLSTLPPQTQSHNSSSHQVYLQPNYYHQHHQQRQPYSVQSPRTPLDFRTDQKPPTSPHDFGKDPIGHGNASTRRHNLGRCCCCYDECLVYAKRGSPPTSERLDKPENPAKYTLE